MGKVSIAIRAALAGLRGLGTLIDYNLTESVAFRVLTKVEALFGSVEVASAQVMLPYFEAAAVELGLQRSVGIAVYNACYALFAF